MNGSSGELILATLSKTKARHFWVKKIPTDFLEIVINTQLPALYGSYRRLNIHTLIYN